MSGAVDADKEKLRRGLYEGIGFDVLLESATPPQRLDVLKIITTDTKAAFRHEFTAAGFPARMTALFDRVQAENPAAADATLVPAAALANSELFGEFLLKRIQDKQLRRAALLCAAGGDSSITPDELSAAKNIGYLLKAERILPKGLLFEALDTAVTKGNVRQVEALAQYAKAHSKHYPGLLEQRTEAGDTLFERAVTGVETRRILRDPSGEMVLALLDGGARPPATVSYTDGGSQPVTENIVDFMRRNEFRIAVVDTVIDALSRSSSWRSRSRDDVLEAKAAPAKEKPAPDTPKDGLER